MLTPFVLALAMAVAPGQAELLKTFREEFVAIEPGALKLEDRKLEISPGFSMARYEVPQNLWESVMGSNPSRWKGKRNSAEMFTFAEAEDFCRRATELLRREKLIGTDEHVRIPTEEEWEYCCRAGSTGKFCFGDDPATLGEFAWFHGNAAGNDPPVGAKKPNALGLYDMHGYLWEFCSGSVARGGSWKDNAEKLTCTSRLKLPADAKDDALGLRCVFAKVPVAVDAKPIAQEQIISSDAKFEIVWAEGEFTEGPASGPDGKIYFSDIGNKIYRFDPKTKKTDVYRDPSGRSNGLIFDRQGRLYAAEGANTGGGRRISITESDGKVRTLADRYEGKHFNSPNDIAVDDKGNVYFTDPRYVGEEPRELDFEVVFFVSSDGKVKIATHEVEKPNGIVLSPDGKSCYVADNNPKGARQLLKFKIGGDGTFDDKEVLFDFGNGRGIDGMTVDAEGNIYATAGAADKAGIYVFNPTGQLLAWFATPGDPTNCEFGGGDEKNVLYVTTAIDRNASKYGLARIKLKKVGR